MKNVKDDLQEIAKEYHDKVNSILMNKEKDKNEVKRRCPVIGCTLISPVSYHVWIIHLESVHIPILNKFLMDQNKKESDTA